MRKYELTLLLDHKTTAAKKKSVSEKIEKLVETFNGKTGKAEDWEKEEGGIYLRFPLELEAKSVNGLREKLRAETEIKRSLLVRE